MEQQRFLINCKGQLMDLSVPKVMGVLNVTPDSFFDGGRYASTDSYKQQVDKMISEGVDIIDVGGMSSRPGAKLITTEEEQSRVLPVIEWIANQTDITISIDTVHSKTAKAAIDQGAHIINDISAGSIDSKMFDTVAELNVPYVLMHMQGRPTDMQNNPAYEAEPFLEIFDFFTKKTRELIALGVKDVILDVGFGFGKSIADNYHLLKKMKGFEVLNYPILAGLSRKSMIYKVLDTTPEEALNGTTALNMIALQNGASILRVHDIKEAKECVTLFEKLKNA